MGILIITLVYALISFFMYKLLEKENKAMVFVVNILCLLSYYCIANGFANIFLYIVGAILNGTFLGLIGIHIYNKEKNLNKFLGTTVLLELLATIIVNSILAVITL